MKRNVDLTENRIFTTPEPLTGLVKELFDSIENTKPWDFKNNSSLIESDLDFKIYANHRRVFAVGNKKERQIWKRNKACDTGEICDCCGQSRGNKPWIKDSCNCYSMPRPKIPWKF